MSEMFGKFIFSFTKSSSTRNPVSRCEFIPNSANSLHSGNSEDEIYYSAADLSYREGYVNFAYNTRYSVATLALGQVKILDCEGHRRSDAHMAVVNNAVRGALRLQGQVAIVTGGASGMGRAAITKFVEHGAKVIIADIQDDLGEKLAADLGGSDVARYIRCDVSKEEQVAAAVDLSVSAFGGLDVMYNNAGVIGTLAAIDQFPMDGFDRSYGILLRGVFMGVKHAARVMKPGRKGSIINTASIGGLRGGISPHDYAIFKHSLAGLVRNAAYELRNFNIRVNNIAPGSIPTPLWQTIPFMADTDTKGNLDLPMAEGVASLHGTTENIADAALFLASSESSFISGHTLVVDGGHYLDPQSRAGDLMVRYQASGK